MSEIVKTIRLSATLRTVAGAKEIQVRVEPSATVRDLLQTLWEDNPALAAHALNVEGGLNDGIQLIVGGRHIEFLQGLDTPIGSQDSFLMIPPLAGG